MDQDESAPAPVRPPTPEQLAVAAGHLPPPAPAEPAGAASAAEPAVAADRRHPGDPAAHAAGWAGRRQARIAAEIARNRRGEYTVPTWVLALTLLVLVGGLVTLVVVS